jgi:membrane protein YdbS with pleckstrin-like domain
MFSLLRRWCERLFRIPPEPGPPPGDEASTRVFRASPSFLRYLKLFWGIGTAASVGGALLFLAIPIVVMNIVSKSEHPATKPILITLGIIFLLCVAANRLLRLALLQLDYEKRWYVVTNRSLRIREGVMHVSEMTITFANIQNIEVQQGPLQRYFKIADLRVDTAGGDASPHPHDPGHSLHTALFRGIDNAAEIKELIQQRLRGLKDAGLGDHDDPRPVASAPADANVLGALREVLAEARALRAVAK